MNFIYNPHTRIIATHILVIVILLVNIMFFTENDVSAFLQAVLILAVILHDKDDRIIKRKLEEKDSKLREDANIFDKNIIVSESDLRGFITYVNDNFCKVSGYTKEELLGSSHSILRDPDTPKEFFEDLWKTIQSGETFHGIIKNICKDGSAYWVDSSISPIRENDNVIGYKAIRFDITDKVLANKMFEYQMIEKDSLLQEQSSRFEFAINSSRDGFWDYNLQTKEFYLSSGWKKRLGFKEAEELTYINFLSLIPDNSRTEHHLAMQDAIDKYSDTLEFVHFRIRYPLITNFGEKLLIEDVGDAFFEDGETLVRITGFHRDITEQDRQAKMIESQNRLAAMGDMIGNIAHQWRQPIGAINNTLNDLEFDIELEDLTQIDSQQFFDVSAKVKEYTAHLSQTIDDFRSIASDDKAKSDFLLIDVLEEAYPIIESEYMKNNIEYIVNIEGECTCNFYGYKRELLQIVINILNNAKDILIEKKIQNPQVRLDLNRDDKNVYVNIHDNAGGVPQSIIEKIFDPYFTTKHESIGTGIGLFMSKKMIIEHFNGSLSVSNEEDGATFCISLPRQDKEKLA